MERLVKRVYEICYTHNNPHLASSLSCLSIIDEIYKKFDFNNDKFILSKGHGCAALFAVLEKYGFKPDVTQRHPDCDLENGVSCITGSLGNGLPVGIGMALAKKIKNEKGKIYVLLGDQEFFEGTTHEGLFLKRKLRLDNLEIHIDNNEKRYKTNFLTSIDNYFSLQSGDIIVHDTDKIYPHVYRMEKDEYEKIIA